jgi:predicted dehydrogenase
MRTIRWGMIGCGEVAEVKSGPGFYKARNSRLVAVMRRHGALAAEFARHHDYTLRCAAARKAVYVEKPMALELTQCIEMVDACMANRVPLWVAHYRRALARFGAVRALVEQGVIGEVRMATLRQFQRMPRSRVACRFGSRETAGPRRLRSATRHTSISL